MRTSARYERWANFFREVHLVEIKTNGSGGLTSGARTDKEKQRYKRLVNKLKTLIRKHVPTHSLKDEPPRYITSSTSTTTGSTSSSSSSATTPSYSLTKQVLGPKTSKTSSSSSSSSSTTTVWRSVAGVITKSTVTKSTCVQKAGAKSKKQSYYL